MDSSCPVCVEDYGRSVKKVKCHLCSYDTCTSCAQQYLLGTPEAPHCMNCRKGWSREFMIQNFTLSFVSNDYKKHRENVLFEREKSLLPSTQPHAERELIIRKKQEELEVAKKNLKKYEQDYFRQNMIISQVHEAKLRLVKEMTPLLPVTYKNCGYDAEAFFITNQRSRTCDGMVYVVCGRTVHGGSCERCRKSLCRKCHRTYVGTIHHCDEADIKKEKQRVRLIEDYVTLMNSENGKHYRDKIQELEAGKVDYINTIRYIKRSIQRVPQVRPPRTRPNENDPEDVGESSSRNVTFIRACPAGECRGFLSTAWKCGMCNIFVCSKCHEVKGLKKDVPHECKTENIETAKLLDKEAKACPNCAALICKVKGCDQMWCTQCHTAFSWNTGKIVKDGPIHNPHFFEYMREHGQQRREIDDIPCGGLPFVHEITQSLSMLLDVQAPEFLMLQAYYQLTGEVMDLRRWYRDRHLEDNRNARVKYLLKDYDDKQFKKVLQMRAKAIEKIQNIDQVLDMFVMVASTIFQRLITAHHWNDVATIPDELTELRRYTNECMDKVSDVYQCKIPYIDDNVVLHRVGERRTG